MIGPFGLADQLAVQHELLLAEEREHRRHVHEIHPEPIRGGDDPAVARADVGPPRLLAMPRRRIEWTRPPARSFASTTCTSAPCASRWSAAASPESPAPMTTTSLRTRCAGMGQRCAGRAVPDGPEATCRERRGLSLMPPELDEGTARSYPGGRGWPHRASFGGPGRPEGQQSAGQRSWLGPREPSAARAGFSVIRSRTRSRIMPTNAGGSRRLPPAPC